MATSQSKAFDIQVAPPSDAVNVPGDATGPAALPPLLQLIAADSAKWVLDQVTQRITRNGVDTKQPYSVVRVLYINTRDPAWLASAGQPDAIWLRDQAGRYAWYNHTTGVWGFAGHGPDMAKY